MLDCLTELYMWVGKGCPNTHRTLIAAKAQVINIFYFIFDLMYLIFNPRRNLYLQ
jgi:hypothetical protein